MAPSQLATAMGCGEGPIVKSRETNWGLAFGSGSFLLVWCLGHLAQVPIDVLLLRSTIGAILGALVGLLVGQTVRGLVSMYEEIDKGRQITGGTVDFTVGTPEAEHAELRVPAAPIVETKQESATDPAAFKPIDYKQAAKQVQSMIQE